MKAPKLISDESSGEDTRGSSWLCTGELAATPVTALAVMALLELNRTATFNSRVAELGTLRISKAMTLHAFS
jgi:hypothetical protein